MTKVETAFEFFGTSVKVRLNLLECMALSAATKLAGGAKDFTNEDYASLKWIYPSLRYFELLLEKRGFSKESKALSLATQLDKEANGTCAKAQFIRSGVECLFSGSPVPEALVGHLSFECDTLPEWLVHAAQLRCNCHESGSFAKISLATGMPASQHSALLAKLRTEWFEDIEDDRDSSKLESVNIVL